MHNKAYTTRDTIRVFPASHRDAEVEYPRGRGRVQDDVRNAVRDMLTDLAQRDRRVWWARRPFDVSVRAGYSRGEWIWHADPTD